LFSSGLYEQWGLGALAFFWQWAFFVRLEHGVVKQALL
jgi:hypothetical protein